jgi:hypothetical protein
MGSNHKKRQARAVVSKRLRLFFSHLREFLAPSADAFWKRFEANEKEKPKGDAQPQ